MTPFRSALLAAASLLVAAPLALAQTTPPASAPASPPTSASTAPVPQSSSQTTTPAPATAPTPAPSAVATNAMPPISGPVTLTAADKRFLAQDARGEAYEMQISQLAEQKATSQAIKQYAAEVVQDHQQTMQTLQQIAQAGGVTLPADPSKRDATRINSLSKLNGTAFDRRYIAEIKAANTRDINEEKSEATRTKSAPLKQALTSFAQIDQKHLQDAQGLRASGNNKS